MCTMLQVEPILSHKRGHSPDVVTSSPWIKTSVSVLCKVARPEVCVLNSVCFLIPHEKGHMLCVYFLYIGPAVYYFRTGFAFPFSPLLSWPCPIELPMVKLNSILISLGFPPVIRLVICEWLTATSLSLKFNCLYLSIVTFCTPVIIVLSWSNVCYNLPFVTIFLIVSYFMHYCNKPISQ
jgi:hypothetical protein